MSHTPDVGVRGTDGWVYSASGGKGGSGQAAVTIAVTGSTGKGVTLVKKAVVKKVKKKKTTVKKTIKRR